MRKFLIVLAAGVVLTAFGCLPTRSCGGELPQSTLAKLPQSTLGCPCGCPCSTGAPCTCGTDCRCLTCPGKSTGIVASRAEAVRSSVTYGCPMVAFVNCPAVSVPGAISYACPQPGQPAGISVGLSGYVLKEFPATAPVDELAAVARPSVQAVAVVQPVAYRPMEFSQMFGGGGCPGGNCGRR